jgi:hypothetical protein
MHPGRACASGTAIHDLGGRPRDLRLLAGGTHASIADGQIDAFSLAHGRERVCMHLP